MKFLDGCRLQTVEVNFHDVGWKHIDLPKQVENTVYKASFTLKKKFTISSLNPYGYNWKLKNTNKIL